MRVLILVLCLTVSAEAQRQSPRPAQRAAQAPPVPTATSHEVAWSAHIAYLKGGEAEFRLPDGSRVDIVENCCDLQVGIAWEVEWCDKWEQSIGQSLFYAAMLDTTAGIILLKRRGDDEDLLRCMVVVQALQRRGVKIQCEVWEVDVSTPKAPEPTPAEAENGEKSSPISDNGTLRGQCFDWVSRKKRREVVDFRV